MKAISIDIAVDKTDPSEQRAALQALRQGVATAEAVFRALHSGISNQLPITRKRLNSLHRDGLAIGTVMLNKLHTMATGTADFLQRLPGNMKAEALE